MTLLEAAEKAVNAFQDEATGEYGYIDNDKLKLIGQIRKAIAEHVK